MGKFLCALILGLFLFQEIKGQETIKYDISVAGFSIGEMVAEKTNKGPETKYEITSQVSFWFFGSVSVDVQMTTHYMENLMTKAIGRTKTNKGDFYSDVKWLDEKKHYKIEATSYKYELDTIINRPFEFSSVKLYFEEPVHYKEFLAENFGLPSSIKKVKNYYEVVVNGHTNRFYYTNGKLERAVMHSSIKNYVIKRISQ